MHFYIETKRLILRDLRMTDAEKFFEMDSHPEVHRFLGNKPITSIEQAYAAITFISQQYQENQIGRLAVIEKASGDFIGWSGLKFVKEETPEASNYYDVGYRFHPRYWGKGYATESGKAALLYGFKIMKLQEIIGAANVENKASRRALEKCGLKFVEHFFWQDIKCDRLKITIEEWRLIPS